MKENINPVPSSSILSALLAQDYTISARDIHPHALIGYLSALEVIANRKKVIGVVLKYGMA